MLQERMLANHCNEHFSALLLQCIDRVNLMFLCVLWPDCSSVDRDLRQNKGSILKASVDYIRKLKRDQEKVRQLEDQRRQLEAANRRYMLKVQVSCLPLTFTITRNYFAYEDLKCQQNLIIIMFFLLMTHSIFIPVVVLSQKGKLYVSMDKFGNNLDVTTTLGWK